MQHLLELLRRAIDKVDELERTVPELELSASDWKHRASEMDQERDEAREAASASRLPHLEIERKYRKEVDEHEVTNLAFNISRVIAFVLFVACGLLTWRLLT